jgi:hypothetical protein
MIPTLLAPMLLTVPMDRPRSTSEVGSQIQRAIDDVSAHLRSSVTYGGPWNTSVAQLVQLREDTSSPNWDGYNAPALSGDVFFYALKFVQTIPFDFPQPEIGASAAGDITFEWAQSPRRIVSVGVSPNGEVHYASLNGAKRSFGSYPFDGTFDPQLRSLIVSVLG